MRIPLLVIWADGTESVGILEPPPGAEAPEGAVELCMDRDTQVPDDLTVGEAFGAIAAGMAEGRRKGAH